MTARAGRWAFAALVLLLTVLFVRLGLWQMDRLEGRRAENDDRRVRVERPPLRIDASVPFPPAESVAWRRTTLTGRFDYAREAVLAPRSSQGSPAVYVVTPLVTADSAAVPILRGSVPAPDGLHARLARARPVWARSDSAARGAATGGPHGIRPGAPRVLVYGSVHRPDGEPVAATDTLLSAGGVHPVLDRMDPDRLDSIWPWRTAGFYVRADSTTERIPAADGLSLPRTVPTPELDDGPHLAYAIQWFAFAAIAVVGGAIYLRREA